MDSHDVHRGDVFWVTLDPTIGSEIEKRRPCVVVQRDAANAVSPTTIVCPLTDATNRRTTIVSVGIAAGDGGLAKASVVLCNQVRTVDRSRLGRRLGTLSTTALHEVERGLVAILDLQVDRKDD